MIYATIIYLDQKNIIQETRTISFSNDFEFRQFMHEVENQEKINDSDEYIKVEIWLQNGDFSNSEKVLEKEFLNGNDNNKKEKIKKEGVILNFPNIVNKDKLLDKL